jgi:hypothetical protein
VVEKESIKQHSQAAAAEKKSFMMPILLIEVLFIVGLHELQVLRKDKWSSVTCIALAGQ